MNIDEFTEMAGERIGFWIDNNLTYENGCKRDLEEGDGFEEGEVLWVFTQKGVRLYDSYVRKVKLLIDRKFPNETPLDIENYTGVIYP